MNKILLNIVMLPSGLWKKMGADVEQLRAILTVKLKMDDRKPITIGSQRRQNKKENKASSLRAMFLTAIMGLVYTMTLGMLLAQGVDTIFSFVAYYSFFLFMLTFLLITDFANVLIDTRDKFILIPRPVNDRTMVLSRLLHICIYLFRVVFPMSLSGWVVTGFFLGWKAALFFPIPVVLLAAMAIFFVNGIYMLLMHFAKPERFKKVMNGLQLVLSLLFIGIYTLNSPMITAIMKATQTPVDILKFGWARYLPSYWLASLWSWVGYKAVLPYTLLLGFVAILFPIVCLWITIKYLAPSFISKLGALDNVDVHETSIVSKKSSGKLYKRLANLLNRDDALKAGFIITWLQSTRSQTFKMRVLPSFVLVPFYFFSLLFMNKGGLSASWQHLPHTKTYLVLLYMCSFPLIQASAYVTISEKYRAAWIYYAAPIGEPGKIMAGAFKAIWIKYFFPFYAFIGVFIISIWGPAAIYDLVLAAINLTLYALAGMLVSQRFFPFSRPDQIANSGFKTFLRMMLATIVIGSLALGHYFTTIPTTWMPFPWLLKIIFLLLSTALFWMLWDSYKKTDWNKLKTAEEFA